jgi:NAD kinase
MYEKIVLVTRKSRLEGLVERFNTKAQAKFYIEHSGGNFGLYEREHETYYTAVGKLRQSLQRLTKLQVIEREFLPNFLFTAHDLVVTIGIDGLVVNTAKYLDGQPLVAVNPDPQHIDGVLLSFNMATAAAAVQRTLHGHMQVRPITMAEARLNDGQRLLAFNDLFVGRYDHVSARYRIAFDGREENHSSSGIIISTGAGSTGWLSSLFNMANGILQGFGESEQTVARPSVAWETDRLIFVVREPFISKTSAADIVCGAIIPEAPLLLESAMPEGGVIFSDGVATDYLAFNAGATATITLAAHKTNLVIG